MYAALVERIAEFRT